MKVQWRTLLAVLPTLFSLVALALGIMVLIAQTSDKQVINRLYFLQLNTSELITTPEYSTFVQTVARELGLHDWYAMGIWSYCEGYNGSWSHPTHCASPRANFVFNPVKIFEDELFNGQTIVMPDSVDSALGTLKTAFNWMKALYVVGTCFYFITACVSVYIFYSRLGSWITSLSSLIALVTFGAASVVSTAICLILRKVVENDISDINLGVNIGIPLFIISWLGVFFGFLAFLMYAVTCCVAPGQRRLERSRERRFKIKSKKSLFPSL